MKALAIAIFAFLAVSCSPFGFNPMGYEKLSMPLDEAWPMVAAMKYIPEEGNYWKSPKEFFEDGGGDCEDFSIALIYLLGEDAELVNINTRLGKHFIVAYHGQYIEPMYPDIFYHAGELDILFRFSYATALSLCTVKGLKAL